MNQRYVPNRATRRQQAASEAIAKLRQARELLSAVGARRAAQKVRLALKSAEGALRHAEGLASRSAEILPSGSIDKVPLGTPGRLVAGNGAPITRSLEHVLGTCGVTAAARRADGSLSLSFDGYTQIDWDSQQTVTRDGQAVLITEDGEEVLEGALRIEALP